MSSASMCSSGQRARIAFSRIFFVLADLVG
jgi:hypothetical protein